MQTSQKYNWNVIYQMWTATWAQKIYHPNNSHNCHLHFQDQVVFFFISSQDTDA